jgi:sugar phosphate isomerase/epimerase
VRDREARVKLSIVTDEIGYDPATAVSVAREWGVTDFELRRVFLKRVPFIEEEGWQVLDDLFLRGGAPVVAISPGLYKCPPGHWEFAWEAGGKLDASLEMCRRLSAPVLVVFGAGRTGRETFQQVADHFGLVARRAEAAGIDVAIEIEAAAICRAVNSPRLGINWDVSNARGSGEAPLPDGYAAVKPWLKHVHVKGSTGSGEGRRVCVLGESDLGWPEIFRRLAADGYAGALSVETHMKPRYEKSRLCVQAAREMFAAAAAGGSVA